MSAGLLACLTSSGFTLRADAGRLVVTPASQLTDELRELIRANKAGLLAALPSAAGPPDLPPGSVVLDTDPDGLRWIKTPTGQRREDFDESAVPLQWR